MSATPVRRCISMSCRQAPVAAVAALLVLAACTTRPPEAKAGPDPYDACFAEPAEWVLLQAPPSEEERLMELTFQQWNIAEHFATASKSPRQVWFGAAPGRAGEGGGELLGCRYELANACKAAQATFTRSGGQWKVEEMTETICVSGTRVGGKRG